MKDKMDSLTDNDIDKIANLLDNRLTPLATKDFVKDEPKKTEERMKTNLKDYIHQGVETIMEGIDNITKQLAEKEKVDKLSRLPAKLVIASSEVENNTKLIIVRAKSRTTLCR